MLPYAFIFWIPTVASLALLWMLWNVDALLGWSPAVFGCWFLVALAMQYFSTGGALWLAGLVSQTALAITLSLKWQLSV